MKVTLKKEFDAFQLTEENSADEGSWPEWMQECAKKEVSDQYYIGRGNKYFEHMDGYDLVLRFADAMVRVSPGDWLIYDGSSVLVRADGIFHQIYAEVK